MGHLTSFISYTHTKMENLKNTLRDPHFVGGFGASLLIVALFAFGASRLFAAMAPEPTLQQKASADLPRVLKVIEETQPAATRNEQARVYKGQLIACIEHGDCSVLEHPMNDRPL